MPWNCLRIESRAPFERAGTAASRGGNHGTTALRRHPGGCARMLSSGIAFQHVQAYLDRTGETGLPGHTGFPARSGRPGMPGQPAPRRLPELLAGPFRFAVRAGAPGRGPASLPIINLGLSSKALKRLSSASVGDPRFGIVLKTSRRRNRSASGIPPATLSLGCTGPCTNRP